jgi:hypothetical protein
MVEAAEPVDAARDGCDELIPTALTSGDGERGDPVGPPR